jgi:hypothetical protein
MARLPHGRGEQFRLAEHAPRSYRGDMTRIGGRATAPLLRRSGRGALAIALVAALAGAQEPTAPVPASVTPEYRHRILGVFDIGSGEPIEAVRVTDMLSHVTALTTKTGTVSLIFLPEGPNLVRIEKLGFAGQTVGVQISPNDTVPVTVLLKPLINTLPTVEVKDTSPHYTSPGLRAFEERRRLAIGHFVAEAELRKHDTEKMTNIIRRYNLSIVCPKSGLRRGECWAESNHHPSKHALQNDGCPVDVWIDGVNVSDNNLNGMSVNEFAGIEFYAGGATVPTKYNRTGSSCGVLLFWTRER